MNEELVIEDVEMGFFFRKAVPKYAE